MRVFQNMTEAYLEIKRDLAKSPSFVQTRVQHLQKQANVREAMNYAYTVMEGITAVQRSNLKTWIPRELEARLYWQPGLITEADHPALKQLLEGQEPSYAYTDRLRGAVDMFVDTLSTNTDSRRAYWPIFQPEDAVRAVRLTRIPCSLGYQMVLRSVGGREDLFLHMTYIMRSCDFGTFWWSDVWLARQFQQHVLSEIAYRAGLSSEHGPRLGYFSHIILSLHSFIDGEIY
jgi:thymidylate synthase